MRFRVVGIHLRDELGDMYGKWTTETRARKKAAWWVEHRLSKLRSVLIEDENGKREVIAS